MIRIHRIALGVSLLAVVFGCSDPSDPAAPGDAGSSDRGAADRGAADRQVTPVKPHTVSLATWNVRNLFDDQDEPGKVDDPTDTATMNAKLDAVTTALLALDADVVALQEVENRTVLDALVKRINDRHGSQNTAKKYVDSKIIDGNDPRGIDVAVLSRYKVDPYTPHLWDKFKGVGSDQNEYRFSRDCPEAHIKLPNGRILVVLVNHLKATTSNPYDDEQRRKAQARRVREILDALLAKDAGADVAVVGDLNDVPGSATLGQILSPAPQVTDVTTAVSAADRYTTKFKDSATKKYKQFDYILAAPGLAADLSPGSVEIHHHAVFGGTSDHYPVKAVFKVR